MSAFLTFLLFLCLLGMAFFFFFVLFCVVSTIRQSLGGPTIHITGSTHTSKTDDGKDRGLTPTHKPVRQQVKDWKYYGKVESEMAGNIDGY